MIEIKGLEKRGDVVDLGGDKMAARLEPGVSYVSEDAVKLYGKELIRAMNNMPYAIRGEGKTLLAADLIVECIESLDKKAKNSRDKTAAKMFHAGWFRRARYILSGERRADKLVERAVDEVERWLNSRQKFWSFELGLEKAGLTDWFNGMVLGS